MPLAIRANQLRKRYEGKPPVDAVRGLDLAVEQGNVLDCWGPTARGRRPPSKFSKGC